MSSSPDCTCGVCPVHGSAASDRPGPAGEGPAWAGPAQEYLDSVVAWLDGPEAMGTGHGALEERLQVDSREQYRLLFQGHLDERARRERRRAEVTGSDGVPRPRVENGHERGLTSVFGSVRVTRKAYRAVPGTAGGAASPGVPGPEPGPEPEQESSPEPALGMESEPEPESGPVGTAAGGRAGNLHPADAVLNLPPVRQSAGLARLAAIEAARGSYDDAREAIERATGVRWGKRQVQDLACHAAVDVPGFYTARRPEPCPQAVLGLQCDRKGS